MLIPLWGERYYEQWLSLAAPALLAPGNILYLHEHADFELVFLCKSQDLDFLQSNATIRQLGAQIRLKTVTIDEFFPPGRSVSYGVPLTLAYAKGIQDLGDDGLGTFVILLNADFVLSAGSLKHLLRRLDDGFHIVTAPSLRVVEAEARPLFEQRLQQHGVDGCFSARAMVAIAARHLHQTVRARTINRDQPIAAFYYHLVYWRLGPACLAARYFLLMPLCFQVRRPVETVVCPVDYGFIEEYCPGGHYTAICDSDELLMLEFQALDSEAELLEVRRQFASPSEAIDYNIAKIVANAGEWSTIEHRRGFSYRLLFHAEDVADVAELAEFDRQMARVVERLPPPVSAIRHYNWLSAVRAYSASLGGDGAPFRPQLLRDDANRSFRILFEHKPGMASRAHDQWPAAVPQWPFPAPLAQAIGAASVVVTLDGLAGEVWRLNPTARLFTVEVSELHGGEMDLVLPPDSIAPGSTLAVYLLIDSLPHWPKVKDMCDAVLAGGGLALVAFRDRLWSSFDPGQHTHSWILSRLAYFFDDDYRAQIEQIPAQPGEPPSPSFPWRVAGPTPPPPCVGFIVTLAERLAAAPAPDQ